jgi:uncharacterized protein (DUF2062 family)
MKNDNGTRVRSEKKGKRYLRTVKYLYLRFVRLRGHPHELALGMALGVFAGMMPVLPFQTALAVFLALIFKASKITAALGTWVSNPLNWYFLYYYSYKIGAWMLGLPGTNQVFHSVMASIHRGEDAWGVFNKIAGAGGGFTAAFLLGGLVLATVFSFPTYFVFLRIFEYFRARRDSIRGEKSCPKDDL